MCDSSGASRRFFLNRLDMCVGKPVTRTQFNATICQEPQGPLAIALWRHRTGQGGDLGALLARNRHRASGARGIFEAIQAEGVVFLGPSTKGLMSHAEGVSHLGVGFASVQFEQAQGAFVPAGFLIALGGQRGQRVPVFGGELDVLFGPESTSLKKIEISNYLIYRVVNGTRIWKF